MGIFPSLWNNPFVPFPSHPFAIIVIVNKSCCLFSPGKAFLLLSNIFLRERVILFAYYAAPNCRRIKKPYVTFHLNSIKTYPIAWPRHVSQLGRPFHLPFCSLNAKIKLPRSGKAKQKRQLQGFALKCWTLRTTQEMSHKIKLNTAGGGVGDALPRCMI